MRGKLKIYLGAAPGAGKTFAMLREGRDKFAEGKDVVIGLVETHNRLRTQEVINGLEIIPRKEIKYHGQVFTDMNVEAVIARKPQICLADELAHDNVPGSERRKRWQDIEKLLEAGIDVITTVNIQHLESLKDMVENIVGIKIQETVPDIIVDAASELQFVDISPEALRKRMRHGNIYPAATIETALTNFFREGNLSALREIGLRRVADSMAPSSVIRKPEDVLVAVSNQKSAGALIRHAVRIARNHHGFASVIHVNNKEVSQDESWRKVCQQLHCPVIDVSSNKVAEAIVNTAKQRGVRHVVIGESRGKKFLRRLRPNIMNTILTNLPRVDIHVIARYGHLDKKTEATQKKPEEYLEQLKPQVNSFRIYLGHTKGCGATYAMNEEAKRRHARGADIVIAVGHKHHPSGKIHIPSSTMQEVVPNCPLNLETILRRNPAVIAVDDLATYTDDGVLVADIIPALLKAGITVIATLHTTDLKSTVDTFKGRLKREVSQPVIDDSVLTQADEVELIDATYETIQRRLKDGEIRPKEGLTEAIRGEFSPEIQQELRKITFRCIAAHTDARLLKYMQKKRIKTLWEVRPRLLVCVPPWPGFDTILNRAAAAAERNDQSLIALSVRNVRTSAKKNMELERYKEQTKKLGGEFVLVESQNIESTIANFAAEHLITEIIVAHRPNKPSQKINNLVRLLSKVDIHIVATE